MPFKFIKNIDIQRQVAKALDKDITLIAADLETEIKRNTPVRTGRLKASFRAAKTGFLKGEVSTNVVYAPFVEFGTRRAAPRAMMQKGAEAVKRKGDRLLKNIKSVL
jgi:HK97 gp10 family phage protein